jgi:hypothetical protein
MSDAGLEEVMLRGHPAQVVNSKLRDLELIIY